MRVLLAAGGMHPEPGGVPLVSGQGGLSAGAAAAALRSGWLAARPDDEVTALPVPDGGPGSALALPAARIRSRTVLHGAGPLGDIREVDLVGLETVPGPEVVPGPEMVPGPVESAGRAGPAEGAAPGPGGRTGSAGPAGRTGPAGPATRRPRSATWFLDAARLTSPPADRALAGRQAREGTTRGLGEVLAAALDATGADDVLIAGLARGAVHDSGAGLLEGLGGPRAAAGLMAGRELVLALADDAPLGGMNGAGQALTALSDLSAQQAQDLDRRACARARRILVELAAPRVGALPVIATPQRTSPAVSVTARGTGAAGGAALVLRALGARALPGPRLMARLVDLASAARRAELIITTAGEVYDVPADGLTAVVGSVATELALPAVLVAGRAAVPRAELAGAGVVGVYALEEAGGSGGAWDREGPRAAAGRVEDMGRRLARTWSR